MKRKINITNKEKKFLLILVTLAILVGSYQFGYQKFHTKASILNISNQELNGKLIELQQKQTKEKKILEETQKYALNTNEILEHFPKLLTQEKNIVFVTELEKYTSMKVNSIAFSQMSLFYTPNGLENITDDSTDTVAIPEDITGESSSTTKDRESVTTEAESDNTAKNSVSGYKTSMTLNYQCTYGGLKKAIDFINTYQDRRHIADITASFDKTTGNLSGTLTIILYQADNGKTYEPPIIDSIGVGKDNIFGTFHK